MIIKILSFDVQPDISQNVYKYSMNGEYQIITGVEFNRKAATQGATSNYTHLANAAV